MDAQTPREFFEEVKELLPPCRRGGEWRVGRG